MPDASSTSSGIGLATALSSLPARLRNELFGAFNEVLRNYREQRWEPSELNGGKLCEVTYTILRGYVDGRYPNKASKPSNMVDACKALEKADGTKFSRSVRIQIPRMLVALYEIRNNRGVGHVGGDVNPNFMDATAVLAMSKWIVADIIRIFHNVSTEEAEKIVETVVERTLPIVWNVGENKRILKPGLSAKDKILILVYHTREWISEEQLRGWVEYSKASDFKAILVKCHKQKLIEYDSTNKKVLLSPVGIRYVEERISMENDPL